MALQRRIRMPKLVMSKSWWQISVAYQYARNIPIKERPLARKNKVKNLLDNGLHGKKFSNHRDAEKAMQDNNLSIDEFDICETCSF
jgi:hypothetical protein